MKSIPHLMTALAVAACLTPAIAKLPAPTEEAKTKAAETKAKADWQAKVDAYQLCKAQDRIAARFKNRTAGTQVRSAGAKSAPPAPTAPGGPPAPAAAASSAPPPPCTDPGAFAYAAPEQKPLESAGAHSPAATAASPPSAKPHSGAFPAKK